jgi:hypothetical protein
LGKALASMTISEAARLQGVSTRHMLRYITVGFKGHKLPAIRMGKKYFIVDDDYRQWRQQCGFDVAPGGSPGDPRLASVSPGDTHPASTAPGASHPAYPPFPLPADPRGVLTNAPHEHSCNHPHPLACKAHFEEQARLQKERLRGYSDESQN